MSRNPAAPVADHEQIAARLAQALAHHGWQETATILLNAGRPFAFLAGQLFYVAQPALVLFWPYELLMRIGQFLEDPDAVSRLLAHLETE